MKPEPLFLSHIHEEAELASGFKAAIEHEFGGFVTVFVSSDPDSNPAGGNFLQHIETQLLHCAASIYLISPVSVLRPWISFELGAVWLRNVGRAHGAPAIPTIPICHSGMTPGKLPVPLNILTAKQASRPGDLRAVFTAIQTAVGGKGALRTDFDAFAATISAFEAAYTVGDALVGLLTMMHTDRDFPSLFAALDVNPQWTSIGMDCGTVPMAVIHHARDLAAGVLKEHISIDVREQGIGFTRSGGTTQEGHLLLRCSTHLLQRFRARILALPKG